MMDIFLLCILQTFFFNLCGLLVHVFVWKLQILKSQTCLCYFVFHLSDVEKTFSTLHFPYPFSWFHCPHRQRGAQGWVGGVFQDGVMGSEAAWRWKEKHGRI